MRNFIFSSICFIILFFGLDFFLVPRLFPLHIAHYEKHEPINTQLEIKSGEKTKLKSQMTDWDNTHTIHPYFGFYGDKKDSLVTTGFEEKIKVGDLGFFCRPTRGDCGQRLLSSHDKNKFRIILTGGSAAAQLYFGKATDIEKTLSIELGKEVEIYTLAFGGFKAPQQLFAIQYLLTLGASFDAVIALDGFNDLVLPEIENRRTKINPTFPRQWRFYVAKKFSKDELKLLVLNERIREEKEHLTEKIKTYPALFWFNTFKVIASLTSKKNEQNNLKEYIDLVEKIQLKNQALYLQTQTLSNPPTLDFSSIGPQLEKVNDKNSIKFIIDYYINSSRLLESILKSNNILYLHFLQPNLMYQPDRKVTPSLDKQKIDVKGPYSSLSKMHYLSLENKFLSQDLRTPPSSLVSLFNDEERNVYSDSCCHFNKLGNDQIAEYIQNKVLEMIK